jgi:hypothetical protein
MNARSGVAAKALLAVTIDPLQSQKKQVLFAWGMRARMKFSPCLCDPFDGRESHERR